MKIETPLCAVCEEDLRGAGFEIQALDKSYRMDRCGLCGQRAPVLRVRMERKREEPRNDPGIE